MLLSTLISGVLLNENVCHIPSVLRQPLAGEVAHETTTYMVTNHKISTPSFGGACGLSNNVIICRYRQNMLLYRLLPL